MADMNRFFGGSPGSVLVKLVVLSLLVGAFMAHLELTPFSLIDRLLYWLRSVFDLSFETVREVGRWILYGAVIVVPIWLLSRLFGRR